MTSVFHKNNLELAFFPYESSLKIRLLDIKNSRCFESEFSDSHCKTLSKSLCLDAKDLYSLLKRAFNSSNEFLTLEIFTFGSLVVKCLLQFPIEKLIECTIPLQETELNNYKKGLYHLQDLEARLTNIDMFFQKEQLKIKRNTHFPSFEFEKASFSFLNKKKQAIRQIEMISPDNELLEGSKLQKITSEPIKFSVVFKGKNSFVEGFVGVAFDNEIGYNKKGCYLMGHGVVYWDGSFLNMNTFIGNEQEISVLISEENDLIRWENKEGEKIFQGRIGCKKNWKGLRPLLGIANKGNSISFL